VWVFGCNQRLDIVVNIYRVLKHNITPETYSGANDVASIMSSLLKEENIELLPSMIPNEITFTTLIQVLAYNGHFEEMLGVFLDMLGVTNCERGAPVVVHRSGKKLPSTYTPTLAIFRAVFLGFARHGVYVPNENSLSSRVQPRNSWSLGRLHSLFETFVSYTYDGLPSNSTVYWIMVAFDKTSNHNVHLLRTTWTRLEQQFQGLPATYNGRLRFLKVMLFGRGQDAQNHLHRHGFATGGRGTSNRKRTDSG
jgi:pentatricopeptide repeat protein